MNAPTKIGNELLPELMALLPVKAPGISVAQMREKLGSKAANQSIQCALAVLEREGIATSYRDLITAKHKAWLFHLVDRQAEADSFEDASEFYGDREA